MKGLLAALTVLWVPAADFASWSELDRALARYDDLRLTVAVSSSMLTSDAQKTLSSWSAKGRLELALRLDGDPVLPLIASRPKAPRPDDAAARLALERERFRVVFGSAPAGFSPGAGAVSPALFEGFQAMGLSWVAVGAYAASTSSWANTGNVVLAPFSAARASGRELSAEDIGIPSSTEPALFVVDEADALVPSGSLLRLLNGPAWRRPSQGWATVSETVEEQRRSLRPANASDSWPAWTGSLDPWSASARAQQAWRFYDEAASTLERYQNSGAADLKVLEAATDRLYAAQSNRFFRELAPDESEAAAKALRSELLWLYRTLKQTPPESLFLSTPSDTRSTSVHISQGDDWIEFDNPPDSFARALPWKIESLRVESSTSSLIFIYRLGEIEAEPALQPVPTAAAELGRVVIETYIDLNHVAGAGATTLLFNRNAFIQARDAWEFAVTASARGAFLYRANPLGTPLQVAPLALSADPATREVRVTLPRSLIRGDPVHWGFLVTTSEEGGAAVLGLLAPLEQQKTLAESPAGARPRLSALRLRAQ